MHILYIIHQFFPKWYTGTERFTLDLAKQMQKQGHYVEVLTYAVGDKSGFSIQDGARFKKYIFQNIPVIALKHLSDMEEVSLEFDVFDSRIEPILRDIITKGKYDVVHVMHPARLGSAIKIAASEGLPIALTLTDFWMMCPKFIAITSNGELCQDSKLGEKCIIQCFGKSFRDKLASRCIAIDEIIHDSDVIISPTNNLKHIFEKNFLSLHLDIINYGYDYSNIKSNSNLYNEKSDITLGFLSTLQPHKGAHILLEAFTKANMANIILKIYGNYFDQDSYYRTLIRKYGNDDRIEFCGEYNHEDLQEIMDHLDLIVVPSIWWENSPLVLMEALAHKIPAIVSDLGGMTEVIRNGENGFVFEAGNSSSLAEVLKKIGEDPSILNSIKAKIRYPQRIEEAAFKYEMIFTKLLKI